MKYYMFLISLLVFASVLGMEEGTLVVNQCTQAINVHCGSSQRGGPVQLLTIVSIEPNGQKTISQSTELIKIEIGNFISMPYELDRLDSMLVVKRKKENKVVVKKDTSSSKLSLEIKK